MLPDRQQAHALIDRIPPEQIGTVISLLQWMTLDPVQRAIATAPVDDEPIPEEEIRAVEEAREWLNHNKPIPFEEVLVDFGLTIDDIRHFSKEESPAEPSRNSP